MKVTSPGRPQDVYTQSLVGPFVWDGTQITFSFPKKAQYTGYDGEDPVARYGAFSDQQMDAVRTILASISSFTNLTFVELGGARAGDATLRFANTAATDTAFAFYPSASDMGGDAWFARTAEMQAPDLSSYAYFSILHEIGHALGLMHPHEPEIGTAMPLDRDWLSYTVMSYRDSQGANPTGGYGTQDGDYPQSYMMEDIAALQYAYGANYTTNSGDTFYLFNPNTAELKIDGVSQGRPLDNVLLRTIWDGGGIDTYSFIGYTGNLWINLEPGRWSSTSGQTVGYGEPYRAPGNIANAHLFEGDMRSLIENAIGGSGDDMMSGNAADNMLKGMKGMDEIYGGDGDDLLIGGAGGDIIEGGYGNDLLRGDSGGDRLEGGFGDDRVLGGGGTDLLEGGAGNDFLNGGGSDDRLYGDAGNDRLVGGSGNDQLEGSDGRDVLVGSGGDDTLIGGVGADRMIGGVGSDIYYMDDPRDVLVEKPGEGTDTIRTAFSIVLPENFENAHLENGNAVSMQGNALDNVLTGNDNANVIDGGAGADIMDGGMGDDVYYVDSSDDVVVERSAFGSIDTVYASASFSLSLMRPAPYSPVTMGPSYIPGARVEYVYLTGNGDFYLRGNEHANTLVGNSGDNLLFGNEGADRLFGGSGNDSLKGGDAVDRLMGGEGNDRLWGDGHGDRLFGDSGSDILYGGDGNDFLSGGSERDRMFGNAGSDTFQFDDGDFAGLNLRSADMIADFSAAEGDILDLKRVDAIDGGGDNSFTWIGHGAFHNNAGELRWEAVDTGVMVYMDTNGDAQADLAIFLYGIDTIAKSDFLL